MIDKGPQGQEMLIGAGIDSPLTLVEARKILREPPKPIAAPSPAGSGGLLGDRAQPSASPVQAPAVSPDPKPEPDPKREPSRAWILIVGAALGTFAYWLKRRRR